MLYNVSWEIKVIWPHAGGKDKIMAKIIVNGKDWTVLGRDEYAEIVEAYRKDVPNLLVARPCIVCGLPVLGEGTDENSPGYEARCPAHI